MSRDSWIWLGIGLFTGGFIVYLLLNKSSQIPEASVPPQPRLGQSAPVYRMNYGTKYVNEEQWEWTDWRGRERRIVVKRNVKVDV